ncbi:MAG: ethanolamine ammonia-lyase subunit EutB [Sediminibacterium sp.]|nr:ethanolamine ammonia-lyase subunit EutB [Sediminibacterium sp.]
MYSQVIQGQRYSFGNLKEVLAKASYLKMGDVVAGIAAQNSKENIAAQMALADISLKDFLNEAVIPYEEDEISRAIIDHYNAQDFSFFSGFTVGSLRDWILSDDFMGNNIQQAQELLSPEMVAAVSKIMRHQDLIIAAKKIQVVTQFNNTVGLPNCFSSRLQPNHPTDDLYHIFSAIIEGLLYGSGDALIGINPALDDDATVKKMLYALDRFIQVFEIPTQACVLNHITQTLRLMEQHVPVHLLFQSIAGSEKTHQHFGINLNILNEAYQAALELPKGKVGNSRTYFETGQGSCLSANGHHNVDQQTLEVRAYFVAKRFKPFLINSVVGFIGPEYLSNGDQIIRAAIEDHFCGKLLGLPMGVDIGYTNHNIATQNDIDVALTMLGSAGCNYIMAIPGSDDIMLNYQTTSFHDTLFIRKLFGYKPAPEFENWLLGKQIVDHNLKPLCLSGNSIFKSFLKQYDGRS